MKNKVLSEIFMFAADKLKKNYGYCGVAEGENIVMLNSDDKKGNDIKITIKIESE